MSDMNCFFVVITKHRWIRCNYEKLFLFQDDVLSFYFPPYYLRTCFNLAYRFIDSHIIVSAVFFVLSVSFFIVVFHFTDGFWFKFIHDRRRWFKFAFHLHFFDGFFDGTPGRIILLALFHTVVFLHSLLLSNRIFLGKVLIIFSFVVGECLPSSTYHLCQQTETDFAVRLAVRSSFPLSGKQRPQESLWNLSFLGFPIGADFVPVIIIP
mmetsp:Transcript_9731/g.20621  ORF Transcript_9731/g.20621 Transcript_9731/m.20621 type:complete len:209 (+) Transcript_9731:415-1041(+)